MKEKAFYARGIGFWATRGLNMDNYNLLSTLIRHIFQYHRWIPLKDGTQSLSTKGIRISKSQVFPWTKRSR